MKRDRPCGRESRRFHRPADRGHPCAKVACALGLRGASLRKLLGAMTSVARVLAQSDAAGLIGHHLL